MSQTPSPRNRRRGMMFMGIGFVIAIVAGLLLALQAASESGGGTLVIGAIVAFAVVAPLVIYGIYLYVQDGDNAADAVSAVEKQRELMDVLRERGRVTIPEMAAALSLSEAEVRDLVNQLIDLGIFMGEVDWSEETLYAPESSRPRLG